MAEEKTKTKEELTKEIDKLMDANTQLRTAILELQGQLEEEKLTSEVLKKDLEGYRALYIKTYKRAADCDKIIAQLRNGGK